MTQPKRKRKPPRFEWTDFDRMYLAFSALLIGRSIYLYLAPLYVR